MLRSLIISNVTCFIRFLYLMKVLSIVQLRIKIVWILQYLVGFRSSHSYLQKLLILSSKQLILNSDVRNAFYNNRWFPGILYKWSVSLNLPNLWGLAYLSLVFGSETTPAPSFLLVGLRIWLLYLYFLFYDDGRFAWLISHFFVDSFERKISYVQLRYYYKLCIAKSLALCLRSYHWNFFL